MKKIIALICVVSVIAVAGCSAEETGSDISDSSDISSTVIETKDSSEITPTADTSVNSDTSDDTADTADNSATSESSEGGATFLKGLASDTIYTSDFKEIFSEDGSDIAPEDFSYDNFSAVLCQGFTYLAEPSGICRTNFDNSDVYDSSSMTFSDYPVEKIRNFKRFNVGDTVCGLTVTSAETNFAKYAESSTFWKADGTTVTGAELNLPEIYFLGSTAEFSGEISVEGYISISSEDQYGITTGDILFLPTEGVLPVMGYELDADGFFHSPRLVASGDAVGQNEYGYISLGNANSTSADLSAIPNDGSYIKVCVTLENLKMNCSIDWINSIVADIVSVEVL